jgi:hypothetical protein
MTDEAMSPLRRRMIEDMTEVIAEDPARLHPHDQESGSFPRAVTRHGELRGHTMLSMVRRYISGRTRDWLKFKNPEAPAVKREAEEEWLR